MKHLSQIPYEEACRLTVPEQETIVFGDTVMRDDTPTDVAILLGGDVCVWEERIAAAVEYYNRGLAPYILVTGGVVRKELPEGPEIEAIAMANRLMEAGIPKEAIIVEPEARTTQENMIYGTLQIYRHLTWEKARRIAIITSRSHMRRSMALARLFLPQMVEVFPYASNKAEEHAPACFSHPFYSMRMREEARLMHILVSTHQIPDITY